MYKNLFIVFSVCVLSACEQQAPESKTSTAPSTAVVAQDSRARIVANNYSDATFKNGIVTIPSKGYSFYFLTDTTSTNPIKVGDHLVFSKTGEAIVTKVDSTPQDGRLAVFVSVDKKLDPMGDGYPNLIVVR